MPNYGEMPQSALADLIATILEQQASKVDLVCYPTIHASLIVLIASVFFACLRGTPIGPSLGRIFNRATLTFGVFVSVLLFNLSLSTHSDLPTYSMFLAHLFDTLQMMLANREVVSIAQESADEYYGILVFYELFVYLAAPVTTFIDILPLFEGTTSRLRVLRQSVTRDTYLITPLNEQTLALAKSISKKHKGGIASFREGLSAKTNIVFTDCGEDIKASLKNRAYDTGAVCVGRSIEETLTGIWRRSKVKVRVVFDGSDVTNLSRAVKIYEDEKSRAQSHKKSDTRIYLYTPLASAGEMLPEQSKNGTVRISRVDWTRNLVKSTLCRYPLFMLNPSPNLAAASFAEAKKKAAHAAKAAKSIRAAKPEKASPEDEGYTLTGTYAVEHQKRMLETDKRRVVIVGAGHVGKEFLKMALAYSRMEGLSFSFDVIDKATDSKDDELCTAKSVLLASAPELFEDNLKVGDDPEIGHSVQFYCIDVNSNKYEEFMLANAPKITYVFIAMGLDTLTADTAMRTRKILECGILKECMKKDEAERKHEYETRWRPVVVAVIDDDGLGKTLTRSTSDNLSQRIDVVGSRESMFTFESMCVKDWRETDYKQRSANQSKEHAKYKMFDFARRRRGRTYDISNLGIDWGADFRSVLECGEQGMTLPEEAETLEAIKIYNRYCRYTPVFEDQSKENHEWLLRMEHRRWAAHTRADGFRTPSKDEVLTYANVFSGGDDAHKSDESGLHACLVSYDELPDIDELCKLIGPASKSKGFKEKNNDHIQVESRTQKDPEQLTEDEG